MLEENKSSNKAAKLQLPNLIKFGYHYLVSNAFYFLPPLFLVFSAHLSAFSLQDALHLTHKLRPSFLTQLWLSLPALFLAALYFKLRPKTVYLVDFACCKPDPVQMVTKEHFMKLSASSGYFTQDSLEMQRKVLERSGYGQRTYGPKALMRQPPCMTLVEARKETEGVIFGAIDALLEKSGVKARDIGILVVNSSTFNTTPSFTALIVNRYALRRNVMSYNLGGMGCSAGVISVDLAKHLLQVHPDTYALVVSTENITNNYYTGNQRSMLVSNCLFRVGGAAVLLSNRPSDRHCSKYQLVRTLRIHNGASDRSYTCVFQREDAAGKVGVELSRDLMVMAGEALKANITKLGPFVLPISEQLRFFISLVANKVLKAKTKLYIPDFTSAFEHFCVHAGGKVVLDEVQRSLRLSEWHMEPSRMALYRFGNTSSSSIWYELAYSEAMGRVKKGHRVWQIGFGSGFKCNSAAWRALRTINPAEEKNPWIHEINEFPAHVPSVAPIVY